MTALPKRRLTPAEYLEIERAAPFRSEYFRGEMFAMAGASFNHVRIADNLSRVLGNALLDGLCYVLSRDMRVKVDATGLYTYPDVLIVCGKAELEDAKGDVLLNPAVIFEILSDSTESYDRGAKFRNYQKIPSLKEYVLISQSEPVVERFVRQPDDSWNLIVFPATVGRFSLATLKAEVAFADLYRGVEFSSRQDAP